MSIELVINLYSGMHFGSELRALNRTAAEITSGVIVAIGSYRGQTDSALAMHAHVPVYCIDPRTPSDDFPFSDADRVEWMRNVLAMGVAEKVRPINLPSLTVAAVWTEPISFLWIDGDHRLVDKDLAAWLPHVIDGGLVGFHDANGPFVAQTIAACPGLTLIETSDITEIYRKGAAAAKPVTPDSPYEPFTAGPLTLDVRTGAYHGADCHAIQEVQDYALPGFPLRTVIDAGAMIGAFSAWVKHLYPDCRVLAIEPEPGNYELLKRNVEPGVTAVKAVLRYDDRYTRLVVDPVNSGGHTLITDVDARPSIEAPTAMTLETIMEGRFERVDCLKLDIELSEMDVLLNAQDDTLRRIGFLTGERHFTHEAFQPVIDRLTALGFDVTDAPHPELSMAPHFMNDRGLFTATNRNWTEESSVTAEYSLDNYRQPDKYTVIPPDGEIPFEYGLAVKEIPDDAMPEPLISDLWDELDASIEKFGNQSVFVNPDNSLSIVDEIPFEYGTALEENEAATDRGEVRSENAPEAVKPSDRKKPPARRSKKKPVARKR